MCCFWAGQEEQPSRWLPSMVVPLLVLSLVAVVGCWSLAMVVVVSCTDLSRCFFLPPGFAPCPIFFHNVTCNRHPVLTLS